MDLFERFKLVLIFLVVESGAGVLLLANSPAYQEGSSITPGSYQDSLAVIENRRLELYNQFRAAQSPIEKDSILGEARKWMVHAITDIIFPFWYGTPWSFEGHTEIPNGGSIACGYFVSTVLRDGGFKVDRYKLAQQASEQTIKNLTSGNYIRRYSDLTIEKFLARITALGEGLYIVGLDIHIGFILHQGGQIYFIHASYGEPYAVVKEVARESLILGASRYRVVGKISADNDLLAKWLEGSE